MRAEVAGAPRGRAGRWVLLALLVGEGGARAAPSRPEVLVVLRGAEEEALLPRLQGQTADLPLHLRPQREPSAARGAAPRVPPGAADAVLWFQALPGGAIQVLLLRGEVLTTREARAPRPREGHAARSAQREEVALLARSLLRGLPAAPVVAAPVVAPAPTAPPVLARRPGWGLAGSLGWWLAADGVSPLQHGPLLQLGVGGATSPGWSLQVAVAALVALPASFSDAYTELRLSRHAVGAALSLRRSLHQRWLLGVGLLGALTLYDRRTSALDPQVQPAPPGVSAGFLVEPTLRAALRVAPGWWLELSGGLDAVLRAPTLVYQQGTPVALVERGTPWAAQPRLALEILRFSPAR